MRLLEGMKEVETLGQQTKYFLVLLTSHTEQCVEGKGTGPEFWGQSWYSHILWARARRKQKVGIKEYSGYPNVK